MPAKKSLVCQAFGRAVRATRVERGEAQEVFAARAGIDRSYYGAIERGEVNCSLDSVVRLAAALGVSVAMLFARAGL